MRWILFITCCLTLSIADSSAQQPESATVITEAAQVSLRAQDALKERNVPEAKRAEAFANISSLRKQIGRILPELKAKITELEKSRSELNDKINEAEQEIQDITQLRSKDRDDLQQVLRSANINVQKVLDELRTVSTIAPDTDDDKRREMLDRRRYLQTQLRTARSEEREAQGSIDKYDQSATRLPEAREALQVLRNNPTLREYDIAKNLERSLQNQALLLDDVVGSLLDIEKARNEFTLWATATFSILVGVVIVLFFVVLLLYADVRVNVFTGDAAIQFVTIFSLVIAIILFGVLRILEGKELAALLGGLSGYILGRGTISRTPQPNQSQGAQPHQAQSAA